MFETIHDGRYGRPSTHRATDGHRSAPRSEPLGRSRWHWLLLLPVIAPLLTPLYNRAAPHLFGMPFFYWFQLGLVVLSTAVITVVHLKTKRRA